MCLCVNDVYASYLPFQCEKKNSGKERGINFIIYRSLFNHKHIKFSTNLIIYLTNRIITLWSVGRSNEYRTKRKSV